MNRAIASLTPGQTIVCQFKYKPIKNQNHGKKSSAH